MNYAHRAIEQKINQYLFDGKILIIYGPRQAGKTTLVKQLLTEYKNISVTYINCDEGDVQRAFAEADTSTKLKSFVGDAKVVVLDEAQRIEDIGIKLKLLIDTYPDVQIIATGSSSFELANRVAEPLTGRTWEFWLYPFSISEVRRSMNAHEFTRLFDELLVYGSYPAVVGAQGKEKKQALVSSIADNYLYKDILAFGKIKNADMIRKLLEALAIQVGNEVSYGELGSLLGISRITVESYIRILEQSFIVFRLPPFSRNLRKELGKLRKIYFYDTGIRNALLGAFQPAHLRTDIGPLWENFVVADILKQNAFIGDMRKLYFWRTHDQQEIDLIEEVQGKLYAHEIKWASLRKQPPKAWREAYPEALWQPITRDNFLKGI